MTDKPKKVTGGCLCGSVRYEAEVFLESGYYCHCRICQKSCGQPADLSVPIRAGTLVFTKSAPQYYVSSEHGRRGFCGICGSRLSWESLDAANDWMSNVTVGSLDDPAAARPSRHIFVDTKLAWYEIDEDLPKFKEAEIDGMVNVWKRERTGQG